VAKKVTAVVKLQLTAGRARAGSISRTQLREIAQTKQTDLNAIDVEGAEKIIAGTARSMGITITD
jgi:large subunit ribosomal protein L11